jgi:hypothetical protein
MDPVIISWTPTNWATIFLMALGGMLIVKVIFVGFNHFVRGDANA